MPIEVKEAQFLPESGAFLFTLDNGVQVCVTGSGIYRMGSVDGKLWGELLEELPFVADKLEA